LRRISSGVSSRNRQPCGEDLCLHNLHNQPPRNPARRRPVTT
jgi:hypothetical protein